MKSNYEMVLVLKPLLPDDVRKAMHKQILALIKEKGGEVDDVDVWGKKYLAYKIAGHTEGYYMVYYFSLDSSEINELKRVIKLKPEYLKFMVVKTNKVFSKTKIKKKEIEII